MKKGIGLHISQHKISLKDLCKQLDIRQISGPERQVLDRVASIADACAGALVLLTSAQYVQQLRKIESLVCLTSADMADQLLSELVNPVILVSEQPKRAFASILNILFPQNMPVAGIDDSAYIHPSSYVDKSAVIEPFAIIGPECHIGPNCVIGQASHLVREVHLQAGCVIGSHNCLSYLQAAEGVRTDAHCVIGKRGFGFEGQGQDIEIMPHLGQVIIGRNCDIGAGVTIDRSVLEATIIGDYVMIDNQCHIAHNVVVADNVIILGQTGIAGSSKIGKNCIIGGQVGIADHVCLADNVIIASKSGVTKDIMEAGTYAGFPAVPAKEYWRQLAQLRRQNKRP